MRTSINPFCEHPLRGLPAYPTSGRIAASRARSLLAYQSDMSRRSLCGSLWCPRETVGRCPLVRERGAAGLPAPDASHRRVRPAIPQNEFLEVR